MSLSLAPFVFALGQAVNLYTRVMGRDGLIARPDYVRKAVAARLAIGVRALEAFLRRVLILMALEIEPELVAPWRPKNLARPKARMPRMKKPFLRIYTAPHGPYYTDFERIFPAGQRGGPASSASSATSYHVPVLVPIDHLLARLDHLHAIAKSPLAKARRLAFSLARNRHGILMAPPEHPSLVRRWGTEVSAIHDAMAYQIMEKSRSRPPPLPPPRRGPIPRITLL